LDNNCIMFVQFCSWNFWEEYSGHRWDSIRSVRGLLERGRRVKRNV